VSHYQTETAPAGAGAGPTVRVLVMLATVAVVGRAACALAVYVARHHYHRSFAALVTRFDGTFYRAIARSGYPSHLPIDAHGHVLINSTAFFPLYPLVVRGIDDVTGLPFDASGLLCNLVCLAVAGLLIRAIWRLAGEDETTALIGSALWMLWPIAYIASMTYSDTLFSVLAAANLYCLLRKRWLLAGIMAGLASATRPTGAVLALCCLYAAVVEFRQGRSLRPWLSVILAPSGVVAYFAYLWAHTGRANAWFVTEKQGWHVYFDGGVDNVDRIGRYVREHNVVGLGLSLFVIVSLVLLVLLLRSRTHPLLLIWAVGVVVLSVTTRNDFSSVPRFLYPAFPLTLPVVRLLRRLGPPLATVLVACSGVAMVGLCVYMTGSSHYPP
jgi:hypothetical protein